MSGDDDSGVRAPLAGILQCELEDAIDKYVGIITLAEVIGVLEIVKIGLYHRGDTQEEDGT